MNSTFIWHWWKSQTLFHDWMSTGHFCKGYEKQAAQEFSFRFCERQVHGQLQSVLFAAVAADRRGGGRHGLLTMNHPLWTKSLLFYFFLPARRLVYGDSRRWQDVTGPLPTVKPSHLHETTRMLELTKLKLIWQTHDKLRWVWVWWMNFVMAYY